MYIEYNFFHITTLETHIVLNKLVKGPQMTEVCKLL